MVIIVTTTRLLSLALSYMNQPRVIAEVLAGIILGPSVLGYIPGWIDTLFPSRCPIDHFSKTQNMKRRAPFTCILVSTIAALAHSRYFPIVPIVLVVLFESRSPE